MNRIKSVCAISRSYLRVPLFAFLCALCGESDFGYAEDYPSKPIRIIVPYPPGGFNDTLARTLGQKLYERWGQAVIVDNRPGGGTTIGTNIAAKSAPDGYTLLIVVGSASGSARDRAECINCAPPR